MSDPKKDVVLTQKQEQFFSRLDFEETVYPFINDRIEDLIRQWVNNGDEDIRFRVKELELLRDLFMEAGTNKSSDS